MREEVAGDWRRLHSEELHNLYTSLNVVMVIKTIMMRYMGHASMHGRDEKFIQNFKRNT
jgi:hypothetical protein